MTTAQPTQPTLPATEPATKTTVKAVKARPAKQVAADAKVPGKTANATVKKAAAAKATTQSATVTPAKRVPTVAKVTKASQPAVKPAKPAKTKKPKLVRDSFTMPKAEYLVLDELKLRAAKLASPIKKTELIRAGIKALAGMSDTAFLAAIKAVPVIKTGRPALS